jgi:uncharacterized protein with PQ loop repeat
MTTDKKKRIFEDIMYSGSILGPLVILPQLIQIWLYQNVQGVSTLTWSLLAVGSFLWFLYGLMHDEKPLALANFMLVICDVLVVVGVFINR